MTAAANSGFIFANFTGCQSSLTNPLTVTVSAACTLTGNFTGVVTATVATNPPNLQIQVDGVAYPFQQTFTWAPGSQHSLAIITNPQGGGTATRYSWLNWSDSGLISHNVTAPAAGTVITYTATFNTQYLLTLAASPGGSGTVVANPPSPAGDGYYNLTTPAQVVQLTATPNAGFQFANYSGDLTGFGNPQSVTMSAPHAVTANFTSGGSGGGPVAANWRLNEASGATSFADSSGNGNTGTCASGDCPAAGVPGKSGTAASFNGTSDQIIVPDSPSLRLNQFSIVLWVNPQQIKSDSQPLVVKENSSGGQRNYALVIAANTMNVRYAVWAGDCATKFAANSVGQLAMNTWNQIAFTYDGTAERFYLNGILDSTNAASTGSLCQAAVPVKIGKEVSVFQGFNGMLENVQIYNQALSAANVASLYGAIAAAWNLDEPSGATSFADSSGNGNTGTCSAGTCPTMGVPGKSGTAASFNGTNDQITVPDSPSLRLNQFTIALWVNPQQIKSDSQPLVVKENSSGGQRNYALVIAANTMNVRYAVWAGDCATKFAFNSTGQLMQNAWNHVVFTYDGSTASLYINGALDSSNAASTGSLCQAAVPVKIGKETSAFQPFNGVLDGIVIYNQALSAVSVASLYGSLVAAWNLDEPPGANLFADSSGHGNTGSCGAACPTMGVPGEVGTAASFNGVNDQIIVPDSPSLRLNQFTIGMWVYPTEVKTNSQPLIAKEDSSGGTRNYALVILANTMQVRYAVWAGDCATKFAFNSAGALTQNAWNHVVFTYDGSTALLYINGALDSTYAAPTGSLCQAAVPVKIGMETSMFQPFSGVLDDIVIYNQAFSSASVASLYQSTAQEKLLF